LFRRELGQCCRLERDLESNFWAEETAPDLAVRSPHPKTLAQAEKVAETGSGRTFAARKDRRLLQWPTI